MCMLGDQQHGLRLLDRPRQMLQLSERSADLELQLAGP